MKTFTFLLLWVPALCFSQNTNTDEVQKQLDSLLEQSAKLITKKKLDEAKPVLQTAEDQCRTTFGDTHVVLGKIEYYRGLISDYEGQPDNAEESYLESLKIYEHTIGKNSLDYAKTLNSLGVLKISQGKYDESERYYLAALPIVEAASGKDNPYYGKILNNLGNLYRKTGNYAKAKNYYLEALEIKRAAVGEDHFDFAIVLESLANFYLETSDFQQAEKLYRQTLGIKAKTVGKEDENYAKSLNNLGILYVKMANFEEALPLLEEAIAIWERTLGADHPNCAMGYCNLGLIYEELGDYYQAEPLLLKAKEVWEKTLGKSHLNVGLMLTNLGSSYQKIGNIEKAERSYLQALEVKEKAVGTEHPDYLRAMSGLASVYASQGQYQRAEPLLLQICETWEKTMGNDNLDYARSLNELASNYVALGQYGKAKPIYIKAKSIEETVIGEKHPTYAALLQGMANMYEQEEHYKEAEELYLRAGSILAESLGTQHQSFASLENQLAHCYLMQGKAEQAAPLLLAAAQTEKLLLKKASTHLSESELVNYIHTFDQTQDWIYSLCEDRPELAEASFDNTLYYKGFLMGALVGIRRLSKDNPESAKLFRQYRYLGRLLAAEYAKPIVEREGVDSLEEEANLLEKELARSVSQYGEAVRQVGWEDVRQKLGEGEAALEFLAYDHFSAKAATDGRLYAALLLRPDSQQPLFVSLFEENKLDARLKNGQDGRPDFVNSLYAQNSLYDLIWKPLEQELVGVKTIYFSTSGTLHRLNLNALPTPDGNTLADRYQLVRLNSTRQLAVPQKASFEGQEALLFGGIQFDLDTTSIIARPDHFEMVATATRGALDFDLADPADRSGQWSFLQWTAVEASSLQFILEESGATASVISGPAATEETFKKIGVGGSSPRVLHLATHGFFFPDPQSEVRDQVGMGSGNEPVFKLSDNPMIRSGLVLAGGNYAWEHGKPFRPGMEDGILTAYEISQMDLSNTELVVLSACETGLGDIQGNEGVYGLQRAFKIAGAKYLFMSLWQVPDFQTQELMTAFYLNWLEEKMAVPDAFRAAQQAMREKYKDPFLWAGFVLVE
ncbi:MAG: tetratricopeptide repeat protein [Saprospiraceae bacterium]